MTEELSKGFTGIEINGVRFSNIKEMLSYMNKQRVRIIDLEKENAEAKNLIEELASSLSVVGECGEEECELINKAQEFINKPIF